MDGNGTKNPIHRRMAAKLGAGLAVLTGLVTRAKPAAAMTPKGDKAGAHYRESPHVKQYYRVNRY